ncbi:hypothetical protein HDU98_009979 [Podochytrium sp. JEL0797]|nr:hypothetical protein HDU98_009979 [Podochytrium sp. JEL0797]
MNASADTVFEDTNQLEIYKDVDWSTFVNGFTPTKNSPELKQSVDPTHNDVNLLAELIARETLKDAIISGGPSINIPTPQLIHPDQQKNNEPLTFHKRMNLESHYTSAKKFECDKCFYTFTQKRDLQRHEKSQHSEKAFVCFGAEQLFWVDKEKWG